MNEIKWAALAAAGLLAVAPEAQATVTGTATLSNFQYQLFDLDPSDGIAPSVSFDTGAFVSASARDVATAFTTSTSEFASGAVGSPLSVSVSQGLSSASAQTTAGSPTSVFAGPGATASATTMGFDNSASANALVLSSEFILSPRTLLVFSAVPLDLALTGSVLGESAYASVSVNLGSNDGTQQSYGQAYSYLFTDGSTYSLLPSLVTASFSNLTGDSVTGYASASSYVTVTSVPVPEPRSYAMMLAGLLAVGALARSWRSR